MHEFNVYGFLCIHNYETGLSKNVYLPEIGDCPAGTTPCVFVQNTGESDYNPEDIFMFTIFDSDEDIRSWIIKHKKLIVDHFNNVITSGDLLDNV